jgi:uncharacterized membrane protein (UPF0127 family)
MRQYRLNVTRAAFAALAVICLLTMAPAFADTVFKTANLKIETKNGPVTLNVEVADTEIKREHGLMFRRGLPEKAGMIFLFDDEHPISMWMKNTYIPLDMVFIGDDWRIKHIVREAEPLSAEIINSGQPASRVLEIGGGEAAKLGLALGDAVSLQQ